MLLIKDLKIREKKLEGKKNSSVFVFNGLPNTFSLTLGNCLRRILLSSIEGFSPIAIKIEDNQGTVMSKFSTLEGIVETTPFLIMNCKNIVLKSSKKKTEFDNEWVKLEVYNEENNEKVIYASDFQLSSDLELVNPSLYLATLAPFSKIKISLCFRKDCGYKTSDENKWNLIDFEEGTIFLDSNYSPIKGDDVNFKIKTLTTALEKEEEELSFEITTNGSLTPKETLIESLEILQNLKDKIIEEI